MDLHTINLKIEELKREKARYTCESQEAQALRRCADDMIHVFERIRSNMYKAAIEAEKLINELRIQNADQCKYPTKTLDLKSSQSFFRYTGSDAVITIWYSMSTHSVSATVEQRQSFWFFTRIG